MVWIFCRPPKFICWNPSPQGDEIRRWSLWEVIRSWGLNLHEWDLCPYKTEKTPLLWGYRNQKKTFLVEVPQGSQNLHNLYVPLSWFPTIQTVRNKSLFFISLRVYRLPRCQKWQSTHLQIQDTQKTRVRSLGWEDPLEEDVAIHCCILAWKIPWTVEPMELESIGSQRVGHNGSD